MASGQFSATFHPNCSSVINRSKRTTEGFNSFIKLSKLTLFSTIDLTSTEVLLKVSDLLVMEAVLEKTILYFSFSNNEINCIILMPAAVVVGSGNICPIIKSVFKL